MNFHTHWRQSQKLQQTIQDCFLECNIVRSHTALSISHWESIKSFMCSGLFQQWQLLSSGQVRFASTSLCFFVQDSLSIHSPFHWPLLAKPSHSLQASLKVRQTHWSGHFELWCACTAPIAKLFSFACLNPDTYFVRRYFSWSPKKASSDGDLDSWYVEDLGRKMHQETKEGRII